MITSRNLIANEEPERSVYIARKPVIEVPPMQEPAVTIARKFKTEFGAIKSDLILEATDTQTSELVKTKTFKIYSHDAHTSNISVMSRVHEFAEELRKEGFKIQQ